MTVYDLHAHSICSDGALTPSALVQRAHEKGVHVLALTDHDCVDGVDEARAAAVAVGIKLVGGVEISVTWEKHLIHVLGLGIDARAEVLQRGLVTLREKRHERARLIGEKLAKAGIEDAYEGARKYAPNDNVTRRHFAQYLIEKGRARTVPQVFESYMRQGKTGYVAMEWATLRECIDWITGAGGVAVIAHPHRYKMTATTLRRLLDDFNLTGGHGIEVVYGGGNDALQNNAEFARRHKLRGSAGSDFHEPGMPGIELGRLAAMPASVQPIWELLSME